MNLNDKSKADYAKEMIGLDNQDRLLRIYPTPYLTKSSLTVCQ